MGNPCFWYSGPNMDIREEKSAGNWCCVRITIELYSTYALVSNTEHHYRWTHLLVPSFRIRVSLLSEVRITIYEAVHCRWSLICVNRLGLFPNAKGMALRSLVELQRIWKRRKGAGGGISDGTWDGIGRSLCSHVFCLCGK